MTSIKTLMVGTVAVAGLSLGLAATAGAQAGKPAGVVTSLQGTANLQRVSATEPAPQLLPLKFRDEVRIADRITTGDQSLARILLGGKAVVTVREHSSLTITETAGASTINITAGKIALAVAKERMNPGERIDIKTPNAVAGVRGTVVITEVSRATASTVEQGGGVNTLFTLLTGALEINLLNSNGQPGPTSFTMGPLQTLSITGFTPPPGGPRNITRQQGQQAANNYKVGFKDAPQGANSQITDSQVEQASNQTAATGGSTGTGSTIINTTNNGPKPSTNGGGYLPPGCGTSCTQPQPVVMPPPPPPPRCRSICEGLSAARRR
jgi:hypothetical protein